MKEEKIGYVYLTTNLVNGKQYVGQHLSEGFDKYYKGSGTAVNRAFKKYGWDNFKCEVICWCSTQTQLNEAEDNCIKLYGTMSPQGYNLKRGGANGRFSKESRKKVSEARKKRFKNPEELKKLSEASKKCWKNEEYRKKQSESNKNNPKQSKTVYQYTLDGKFVKEWCSVREIERVLGFNHGNISTCCNGKLKSAYDHLWSFELLN